MSSLWVKLDGSDTLAVKVSVAEVEDIADLAKAVKAELANQLGVVDASQLTIHLTAGREALEPDMLLSDLSPSAGKSAKAALIVKVTGAAAGKLFI